MVSSSRRNFSRTSTRQISTRLQIGSVRMSSFPRAWSIASHPERRMILDRKSKVCFRDMVKQLYRRKNTHSGSSKISSLRTSQISHKLVSSSPTTSNHTKKRKSEFLTVDTRVSRISVLSRVMTHSTKSWVIHRIVNTLRISKGRKLHLL